MRKILTSAVVVCCALVASMSAAMATPLRSSSPALRSSPPSGWIEVAYKDAQVAVPRSFAVVYPNEQYCGVFASTGTVFLGAVACLPVVLGEPVRRRPGDSCVPAVAVLLTRVAAGVQVDSPRRSDLVSGQRQWRTRLLLHLPSVPRSRPTVRTRSVCLAPSLPRRGASCSQLGQHRRSPPLGGGSASTVSLSPCPSDWAVKRTVYATGIGQICSVSGVALGLADSVVLSTDKKLYVIACPLIGQWPQAPRRRRANRRGTRCAHCHCLGPLLEPQGAACMSRRRIELHRTRFLC